MTDLAEQRKWEPKCLTVGIDKDGSKALQG